MRTDGICAVLTGSSTQVTPTLCVGDPPGIILNENTQLVFSQIRSCYTSADGVELRVGWVGIEIVHGRTIVTMNLVRGRTISLPSQRNRRGNSSIFYPFPCGREWSDVTFLTNPIPAVM